MTKIQKRTVVVTGGTKGIGRKIAEHLAGLGHLVVAIGDTRSPESSSSTLVRTVGADLRSVGTLPAAFEEANQLLGRIDALINALDDDTPSAVGTTPSAWKDILDDNAKAVFFSSQAVIPFMKENGGIIVNLTSVRGVVAAQDQIAYSAAKAGVAAMTRDLATDLGRYSIKCNSLMLFADDSAGLTTPAPSTKDICEAAAALITDGAYYALDAFDYPLDAGTSILLDAVPEATPAAGVEGSKVAVFTGGSRGLGAASARVFAERGIRIAILDILDEQGEALVKELSEYADAAYFHCDVADNKSIFDTIDAVYERFGRIDILLNAAAITSRKRTPEITEADWDVFMDIDLKGTFYMAMACARYMSLSGGGRIVNFSSMLSTLSHGRHTLYGGAKEAVNSMTRALAAALKKDNIQVFSVLPAYVVTPMISFRLTDQEWIDRNYRQSLSKVLLMPEHVTDVFHFLATSETAASTGHKIYVDTGYLNFRYKLVPWDEQTEDEEALAHATN